jgi:hypothetical protein
MEELSEMKDENGLFYRKIQATGSSILCGGENETTSMSKQFNNTCFR